MIMRKYLLSRLIRTSTEGQRLKIKNKKHVQVHIKMHVQVQVHIKMQKHYRNVC